MNEINAGDKLAEDISLNSGVPEKEVKKVLRALSDYIVECVLLEEIVRLSRLGCFSLGFMPSRPAKNMKTGETMIVQPYHYLKFKASMTTQRKIRSLKKIERYGI